MMPDQLKHARLVLTQALTEDTKLKKAYIANVAEVLSEVQQGFAQIGAYVDLSDKFILSATAEKVVARLFPKSELDKVGVPLTAPPAKKPRLLTVGERFYYPQAKKFGHILSISSNPNMPIARVLFEDNVAGTLPLRALVEPP